MQKSRETARPSQSSSKHSEPGGHPRPGVRLQVGNPNLKQSAQLQRFG